MYGFEVYASWIVIALHIREWALTFVYKLENILSKKIATSLMGFDPRICRIVRHRSTN